MDKGEKQKQDYRTKYKIKRKSDINKSAKTESQVAADSEDLVKLAPESTKQKVQVISAEHEDQKDSELTGLNATVEAEKHIGAGNEATIVDSSPNGTREVESSSAEENKAKSAANTSEQVERPKREMQKVENTPNESPVMKAVKSRSLSIENSEKKKAKVDKPTNDQIDERSNIKEAIKNSEINEEMTNPLEKNVKSTDNLNRTLSYPVVIINEKKNEVNYF